MLNMQKHTYTAEVYRNWDSYHCQYSISCNVTFVARLFAATLYISKNLVVSRNDLVSNFADHHPH